MDKKSVSEILIERILKTIDEKGYIPWMCPYGRYTAFNWATMTPYRGINKLLLENGEYLTMNQIRSYNSKHGTDFRGPSDMNLWEMVVFYKSDRRYVSEEEWDKLGTNTGYYAFISNNMNARIGRWLYYVDSVNKNIIKSRNILRYSYVCERSNIKDGNGNLLPSRFEQGLAELTMSKPDEVFKNYTNREGIKVSIVSGSIPNYNLIGDRMTLNPIIRDEKYYWQVAFHESAHSTGTKNRLNREFFRIANGEEGDVTDARAKEECIAEICSSMLCSECGIDEFGIDGSEFTSIASYVDGWKSRIQNWGSSFVWIASEAEKAFDRIMGANVIKEESNCGTEEF